MTKGYANISPHTWQLYIQFIKLDTPLRYCQLLQIQLGILYFGQERETERKKKEREREAYLSWFLINLLAM